ncbi:hypothetical protein [Robertkochia solimangrovi]|uniref:hypothetical protein n=1 Tax=Robertkochia solimangrovi TaxID=2213046 RepID=UPI00117E4AA9|nr:hypothetical protein [Robertkochia solimangrovi]TRZ46341.1 hypothetical protein DMZ48_03545 [Robertkochia solimangrovi]
MLFSQIREKEVDQYLENCINTYYNYDENTSHKLTAMELHLDFENHLLKNGILTGRTKKDYLILFKKIEENEFQQEDILTIYHKLNFDLNSHIRRSLMLDKLCFVEAYESDLYNSENWRYKYMSEVFKINEEGNSGPLNDFKKILAPIPEDQFQKAVYRYFTITIAMKLIDEKAFLNEN